ncbi:cobalt-precorrin-5B (C(1))-methyltransferase CbiD [Candidatus Marinarcus aquaticus]|uniref:Cobalt-precorrin-5B C(1)-methyltransferase n=1 Tax=Candidatus Marinarcus aquaticus TaxID=2044504 RepID=A0A4Q0XMD4_9BACT|nr:cobalt-precorrin-5B (C(1))-methyltransferase CbiD [Candidatus Marinarcus aquaticus]RXJ54093.1 cobalamin biosynthesis protein CbiD [Candidatus Marinarcus aquaticus]
MSERVLKKGYTTGAHAHMLFIKALESFLVTRSTVHCYTTKMDNDDLDVTKGCEIVFTLTCSFEELTLNPIIHKPFVCESKGNQLFLYAGEGVGVVTKKGLKVSAGFPAINPVPQEAIFNTFKKMTTNIKGLDLFACIGVSNGEEIAKQTANAKVGVLGGISILGTTGIVKPISSSAYIDSVRTEIEFAVENGHKRLYFTLGNSAYEQAKRHSSEEAIIEIGNFVYDSIEIAKHLKVQEVVFLCGIGKMTKVYQGFKNTHNRFGVIDFEQLKQDIMKTLHYEVDIEATLTVKGVSQELEKQGLLEAFYDMVTQKANQQIAYWHKDVNIKAVILEQKEVLGW